MFAFAFCNAAANFSDFESLMKTRRLVETVIGQLTNRFHIEKVRARDSLHFSNRFILKVEYRVTKNVTGFFNMKLGFRSTKGIIREQ